VLHPEEIKYFLSNAPPDTSTESLLLVAFSRWKIERMFEDGKGELGLDHFEVRKYLSLRRHLILSCVSYQFLAEFHQQHRGEKPGLGGLPGAYRDRPTGPALVSWGALFAEVCREYPADPAGDSATQPQVRPLPSQANPSPLTPDRAVSQRPTHVQVASVVAL